MTISCPICERKSKKIRFFATRKNENLDLYQCTQCANEFLYPTPSSDWLSEEYNNYFERRYKGTNTDKVEYFKGILSNLEFDFNNKRILELGPGEGDAIRAIKELWPRAQFTAVEKGLDLSDDFKDINIECHNMFLEDFLEKNNDSNFDYILMFDVIEHLITPKETMNKIFQLLKPDGILISSLPNSDSLSRRLFGKLWPQYKVEHINYVTKKSLIHFENKFNLELIIKRQLLKTLKIAYILQVGSEFGPDTFKKITKFIKNIIPKFIQNLYLKMGYGELLWVVRKR